MTVDKADELSHNRFRRNAMPFEVVFKDAFRGRLFSDAKETGGFPQGVPRAFRKRIWRFLNAADERDFLGPSGQCEKLKGNRDHQYSMRLNDQWRLIFEVHGKGRTKTLLVVGIEDYH